MELTFGQRVIRTPVNRAAMPVGAFIAITPGATIPLATTVSVNDAGVRTVTRSSQFNCQIDCYGPDAGDTAELLTILFREQYGIERFASYGIDVTPLYCGDIQQMPIVTGEEQYLERWMFEMSVQFNPSVPIAAQSANMLAVTLNPI